MQNKNAVADLVKYTASLKAEKEKITEEIKALNEAHLAQVESLRAAIAQIRRETVGMSFDELALTSGMPLKKAMIQEVSEDEIAKRKTAWKPAPPRYHRGYVKLHVEHVTQANEGADLDFLQNGPPVPEPDIY